MVGVSTIVSHPGYNTRTKENDIALLKLQQPLVFNQFVRPIDIWMTSLPNFWKCTITGWGSTRESEELFTEGVFVPSISDTYTDTWAMMQFRDD